MLIITFALNTSKMKKTLLFFSLAAAITANAQYSRTAADGPVVGDVWNTAADTIPNEGINPGMAGQAQAYSILDVDFNVEENTNFNSPDDYSSGGDFPEADVAFDFEGGLIAFADVTDNKMEIVGAEIDLGMGPESNKWEDPLTFQVYPYAFGDSYEDVGRFKQSFYIGQNFQGLQIDSGRIDLTIEVDSEVDGSGTFEFFQGTYPDVIRERQVQTVTQKFEICVVFLPGLPCQWQDASDLTGGSSEPETTVTYNYFGEEDKFPYATLTFNETEDTCQFVQVNFKEFSTSVVELEGLENALYPNPANDFVYIKAADATAIEIRDINGKMVLSQAVKPNTKVDIAKLKQGVYAVTVRGNKNLSNGTLIKQ